MREFPRIWDVEISPRNASGTPVTFAYSSHARDSVVARVDDPGTVPATMFSGTALSGSMEIGGVSIVLRNEDGALDFLRDYAFDGCAVFVSAFDQVNTSDTNAGLILTGPDSGVTEAEDSCSLTGEQAVFDEGTVTIVCRDYRHNLDQPLLFKKYAGTNTGSPLAGIEGTANDLKGHSKPVLVGTVFNITPNLVNTDKRIYQVEGTYPYSNPFSGISHSGGLITGYSITVYDKRSAITRGADYTSQADMEANVPAASTYRLWPAGACFRLGSVPLGRVTCDVTNPPQVPATNPLLPGDTNSLQGVCDRLVRIVDAAPSASTLFEALWTSNPQAGIYINDDSEISALSALEQALGSVGAFITDENASWQALSSAFSPPYFFQLNAPESLPYTPWFDAPFTINRSNILPGTLQQIVPPGAERGLPVWRVNVNYKRNYTVMSDADLAGVAAADAEFCKKEWRTVDAHDNTVLTQWPDAIELTFDTLLVVQSEAQAEANRLLALFGKRRQMFRVRIYGWSVRHETQFMSFGRSSYSSGDLTYTSLVKVTYPRFGMDAGRLFVVIAVNKNLKDDVFDVVLWG